MNFLCKYIGGSHLYGLNTENSDIDYRGVYKNDDLYYTYAHKKAENKVSTGEVEDSAYYEVRHYFDLLRKTNTQAIEPLFCDTYEEESPKWELIKQLRDNLIDVNRLIKSAIGYSISESRLAMGERTGKLGSKRKANLDLYGYSPKNVAQIIRIVTATECFVFNGHYPLKLRCYDTQAHIEAFNIKNSKVGEYTTENIKSIIESYIKRVKKLEEVKNPYPSKFDFNVAGLLLKEIYTG